MGLGVRASQLFRQCGWELCHLGPLAETSAISDPAPPANPGAAKAGSYLPPHHSITHGHQTTGTRGSCVRAAGCSWGPGPFAVSSSPDPTATLRDTPLPPREPQAEPLVFAHPRSLPASEGLLLQGLQPAVGRSLCSPDTLHGCLAPPPLHGLSKSPAHEFPAQWWGEIAAFHQLTVIRDTATAPGSHLRPPPHLPF